MITVLVPAESGAGLSTRLTGLGFPVKTLDLRTLGQLRGGPAAGVILIPETAMREPSWARRRVELNQASRQFIVCLDQADVAAAVRAMREGAHDVVTVSDPIERWQEAIAGAARAQELWQHLYGGAALTAGEVLVGRSEALNRLRQTILKLGPTDVTVLVQGESGVGKECVAEALHKASRRQPLVSLNCAAIPKDLIEAELFGAEKGAFTGAVRSRPGVFERAAQGTLFLDEIGELDLSVQPKLLRVLESRSARRVGGDTEYRIHARIVAATNRNLDEEVVAGRFRLDLFYRIAEIVLQAPPLRTRPEDIPDLALKFLAGANERFGKNFQTLEPALITRFQAHAWPGNVRELKSAIDRLVLMYDGPVLRETWWEAGPAGPAPAAATAATPAPAPAAFDRGSGASQAPLPALTALPNRREKLALAKRLLAAGEPPSRVAAQLGVNASTLFRWRQAGKV